VHVKKKTSWTSSFVKSERPVSCVFASSSKLFLRLQQQTVSSPPAANCAFAFSSKLCLRLQQQTVSSPPAANCVFASSSKLCLRLQQQTVSSPPAANCVFAFSSKLCLNLQQQTVSSPPAANSLHICKFHICCLICEGSFIFSSKPCTKFRDKCVSNFSIPKLLVTFYRPLPRAFPSLISFNQWGVSILI